MALGARDTHKDVGLVRMPSSCSIYPCTVRLTQAIAEFYKLLFFSAVPWGASMKVDKVARFPYGEYTGYIHRINFHYAMLTAGGESSYIIVF